MPALGQVLGTGLEAQVCDAVSELMFQFRKTGKPRNQPGQETTDCGQCCEDVRVGEGAERCVTWGRPGEVNRAWEELYRRGGDSDRRSSAVGMS